MASGVAATRLEKVACCKVANLELRAFVKQSILDWRLGL